MAGINKHQPGGCSCACTCPIQLCVIPYCTNSGDIFGQNRSNWCGIPLKNWTNNVSGATVVLSQSGSTIATQTTGSSGTCFTIASAGTYDYEISKTDYQTITGSIAVTCGGNYSIKPEMCRTAVTLRVSVRMGAVIGDDCSYLCLMPGALVELSGPPVVSSDFTGAGGYVDLGIEMPEDACSVDVTVTVTPPEGSGADVRVVTFTGIRPCDRYALPVTVHPDADHIYLVTNGKFMPKTISYSDTNGSCTCTWNTATLQYEGSYTWSCSDAAVDNDCGGGKLPD
jgi:hypothetical protein